MSGLSMAARLELIRDRLEMARQLRAHGDLVAAADQLTDAVEDVVGVVADLTDRESTG